MAVIELTAIFLCGMILILISQDLEAMFWQIKEWNQCKMQDSSQKTRGKSMGDSPNLLEGNHIRKLFCGIILCRSHIYEIPYSENSRFWL